MSKVSATLWVLTSALIVAGAWVLYTYPPATTAFYPQCVFRAATGFDCPGCGTTRALHHLLHGRVGDAFRLNAMLFALMGVAVAAAPSVIRRRTPPFLTAPWFGWTSLTVIVGWWILRNL